MGLIINDNGALLAPYLTPGHTEDRNPLGVMTHNLFGQLCGDQAYLSQALFATLLEQGLELTTFRKTRNNRLMRPDDKILLRKRCIETVHDQLKNISHIEHSRHRNALNFAVNLSAALIAYQSQPKKPSLDLQFVPDNLPLLI